MTERESSEDQAKEFLREAEEASVGLVGEFIAFLLENKKWWLAPIILCLLFLGAVVLLSGGGAAAPFIYTLF